MRLLKTELPLLRKELKGKKIVSAIGAFDLFHVGHMDYLRWARQISGKGGLAVVVR